MIDHLNAREQRALHAMLSCPYGFELKGKMGADIGLKTLDALVARGFAEEGNCPRQRGSRGWKITAAGKAALGLKVA